VCFSLCVHLLICSPSWRSAQYLKINIAMLLCTYTKPLINNEFNKFTFGCIAYIILIIVGKLTSYLVAFARSKLAVGISDSRCTYISTLMHAHSKSLVHSAHRCACGCPSCDTKVCMLFCCHRLHFCVQNICFCICLYACIHQSYDHTLVDCVICRAIAEYFNHTKNNYKEWHNTACMASIYLTTSR